MNKTMTLAALAAFTLALACAAAAATDPLIGTWKALSKAGDHETMTVMKAPGGYTFHLDIRGAHGGGMQMPLAVVLDGKPHTLDANGAPVTATCHRANAQTLACDINLFGEPTHSVYTLSPDGQALTETDISNEVTVNYSSQQTVTAGTGGVSHGPVSSSQKSTVKQHTETMVFHRQ